MFRREYNVRVVFYYVLFVRGLEPTDGGFKNTVLYTNRSRFYDGGKVHRL